MMRIVLLYALFGGTFSLGKLILGYTQPIFLVGARMSIAGLILITYHWFADQKKLHIARTDWLRFFLATIFTIYIPYMLRYWALSYVPSSKACLLYNFGPFVTFLLSYLLYKEKVTLKKVIGITIGFCGLLPIIAKGSCNILGESFFALPDLAIIMATTSSSYGWLMVHQLIKQKTYSVFFINGITMLIGGCFALITSFFIEYKTGFVSEIIPFVCLLSIIIIISNLVCHNLYGNLLRKYSPTLISFAQFLSPIFAAFYGWAFLGEAITWQFIASASIVCTGLFLFYQDELRDGRPLFEKEKKYTHVIGNIEGDVELQ